MQAPKNEIKPWDLFAIAYRRRWEIILPLFVSVLAGLVLSFILPKAYKASTMILVQPQKLPIDVVRSVVPEDEDSRLSNIAQMILNRANLERIISDFALFSEPLNLDVPMEGKIDKLRQNITIELVEEGLYTNAFKVSFKGAEPQTVMEVTNALANSFIDANLKERESSAIGTSSFLDNELEITRKQLGEMEATLKDYRQRYMGALPEQLNSNLTAIERLQGQLINQEDSLREIRLSLSDIDKQIEEERYLSTVNTLSGKDGSTILEVETTDVGLLKEQLANLLTRYTDQHPDVRNLKSKIAQLEAEIATAKGGSSTIDRSGFVGSRSRYNQKLESQRAGLLSEKMSVEAKIATLNRDIAKYQNRVENTPKHEQEFVTLQRDYDNLSASYKSLLNSKLEAEMAVSMERKLKGEKFQILENARLPKNPVEPNLKLMIIVSIALGVGMGSGLVLLLEKMNNTYSGPDEIETELELPVIATIPQILTKRNIFMKRAEVTLCSLVIIMTVIAIGAFAYVSLSGTDLVIETVRQYMNT